MDWNECKQKKLVKQITPDIELAKSLILTSNNKYATQKLLELTEITATSKISLVYDALREKLEALAVINGWKIYQHDPYSAFLKEILNQSELGDIFTMLRKVRNDINYYGKNILTTDAKEIIKELEFAIKKVDELLEKYKI